MATALHPTTPQYISQLQFAPQGAEGERRQEFLSTISQYSNATIYLVPRDGLIELSADAIQSGFYACSINPAMDTDYPQRLLVLGQNEAAVEHVCEQMMLKRRNLDLSSDSFPGVVTGTNPGPCEKSSNVPDVATAARRRKSSDFRGVTTLEATRGKSNESYGVATSAALVGAMGLLVGLVFMYRNFRWYFEFHFYGSG